MNTKIVFKDENLPIANFGLIVLEVFKWFSLLLIAFLLEKGLDSFITRWDFSTLDDYSFPSYLFAGNVTYAYFLYSFLLFNYILLTIRYLIWSPWPIYRWIFDLSKHEFKSNNDRIKFHKLIGGIANINQIDIGRTAFFLVSEFFIAYMAVKTISTPNISLIFLLLLPLIDYILPSLYLIPRRFILFLIDIFKFIKAKVEQKVFVLESSKIEKTDFLIPKIFNIPNLLDFILPIIGIIIFFLINNDSISISSLLHVQEDRMNLFILIIGFCLFLSNITVYLMLNGYYRDIIYILFKLRFIKDSLHSKDRPISYKTGIINFYGHDLKINESVYPPTKETEFLIKKVIDHINSEGINETATILEIGTGSGNIAIALGKKFEKITIYSIEKSSLAIELAKNNLKKNNVKNVKIYHGELLSVYNDKEFHKTNPNVIVANLPYGSDEYILKSNNKESLKYMPKESYFPNVKESSPFRDKKIVASYLELIGQIKKYKKSTTLFIETGPIPKDKLEELFEDSFEFIYNSSDNYSICKFAF